MEQSGGQEKKIKCIKWEKTHGLQARRDQAKSWDFPWWPGMITVISNTNKILLAPTAIWPGPELWVLSMLCLMIPPQNICILPNQVKCLQFKRQITNWTDLKLNHYAGLVSVCDKCPPPCLSSDAGAHEFVHLSVNENICNSLCFFFPLCSGINGDSLRV